MLGIWRKSRQKGAVTTTLRLQPFFGRSVDSLLRRAGLACLALLLGLGAAALVAQMEGERGVPPIASSGDFEAGSISVDVYAETAEAARNIAWRRAQRLGWQKLWAANNGGGAPALSDSQLDQIVSGIEIESEQMSPRRYIASLRVLFDRARAGQILGVTSRAMRSPPLLVVPVLWQGGSATSFESVNEWQKAWARYRVADSAIDYVRVSGAGADAVLLNFGQTGRRGRNWWRNLLEEYGAADVVIPIARLERQWPGGPVLGRFAARYGPDNSLIGSFALRVSGEDGIPRMLDDAVRRINDLYTRALLDGTLRPDPSLIIEEPVNASELPLGDGDSMPVEDVGAVALTPSMGSFSLQYPTPNVGSVGQAEALIATIPGVRSASTNSLALGGTSLMQVVFDGSPDMFKTALQARGFTVTGSGTVLAIARRPAGAADQ